MKSVNCSIAVTAVVFTLVGTSLAFVADDKPLRQTQDRPNIIFIFADDPTPE